MRIFKYKLKLTGLQEVEAPKGWQPLSVAEQFGELCIWAAVDPNAKCEKHSVWIHGAGHEALAMSMGAKFLGTVVTESGALVWHVFVAKETHDHDV